MFHRSSLTYVNGFRQIPETLKAMQNVEKSFESFSISQKWRELARLRASHINGCPVCVSVHSKEALAGGVSDTQIHQLPVWPHSNAFDEKEKAVLFWTDKLTKPHKGISLADVQRVREHLSEKEVVELTAVLSSINAFNRATLAFDLMERK
ncbi:4-carboxymuconolactone decarboxylase domain-containing protein [Angomonas deanei]|uniref:Carboxymuconolactone decarboxylase family, putative n=1 Tax=Angomonas deanei TaxID=59799 RepID=A0A7G2CT03_9TRYP|nr:4-carboxymuconolactone decarboxylase domain-containing protein [Angomonas deanei]CAD2222956.1 Carboxymuconolactone decarboxylase family, putative [Angomonas deanei]|eukprot:EPY14982.1 4-carboxymuconolactone decarboxylase domain-containing protein [Angomonas deanei]